MPTDRRRRVALLVAVLVVAAAGVVVGKEMGRAGGSDRTTSGPPTVVRSDPAPGLTGTTLAGDSLDLATLRGRPVLVNMWAVWCDPCRAELPLLAEVARRWATEGLAVVTVAVRDDPDAARRLLAELGLTSLPVLLDRSGTLAVSWGVVGVPETFLVDRSGVVRVRARGAVTASWLDEHMPRMVTG